MDFAYTMIRSNRKTMAIQVEDGGRVIVRVPVTVSQREADRFVEKNLGWICQKRMEIQEAERNAPEITDEKRREGIEAAKAYIPGRVAYYAARMGVSYNRITIREQKTRWGSCSSKGNLNFNWKLMLLPREALDYVVVHELAHRREMNHSWRFWRIVEAELPDYQARRQLLKEYRLY